MHRIGFMRLDDMTSVVHDYFFRLLKYLPVPYSIESISPQYGAIALKAILDIRIEQVDSFHVELDINNGHSIAEYPPPMNFVFSNSPDLEPRSLFYSLTPIVKSQSGAASERGIPFAGYIEVVLSDEDIQRQRLFVPRDSSAASSLAAPPPPSPSPSPSLWAPWRKTELCIWGPRGIDGQKRIWMQQAELLDPTKFRVSWVLDPRNEDGPLAAQLRHLRPPPQLVASPLIGLPLPLEDLRRNPPAAHWQVPQEQFAQLLTAELRTDADYDLLYRFAHDRLRLANFSVELLTPRWCRAIFDSVTDLLRRQRCDVLVFGNSRGFSSNVILTDAARLLGLPAVAELVNLHLHPDIVPSVLVAPSTFALTHR